MLYMLVSQKTSKSFLVLNYTVQYYDFSN